MAGVKELSKVDMVSLVREILHGKDLSKVTARTVREEVISRLGSAATADVTALKAAVKSALDVVLAEAVQQQQEREADEPTVQKTHDVEIPTVEQTGDKRADDDFEDQEENDEPGIGKNEDSGSEFEEEDMEPVQRSKRTPKPDSREPHSRPQKRARVSGGDDCPFKSETDYNRLKRVCRQMGCPAPPSRQKGSNIREKCANVLGFLRSKGVTDRDPTRLRKEEINAHRLRIEREKDLEGLDVSNIIEEQGRPRRRRVAVHAAKNEDLPSDFSGPELSEKSDDEGEEFAISDAESV